MQYKNLYQNFIENRNVTNSDFGRIPNFTHAGKPNIEFISKIVIVSQRELLCASKG